MSYLLITIIENLIGFIIYGLILWLFSKIFKFENQSYKPAFIISAITTLYSLFVVEGYHLLFKVLMPIWLSLFNLLITLILSIILIKYLYKSPWGKAFLVGIIVFIINSIVVSLILLIEEITIGLQKSPLVK